MEITQLHYFKTVALYENFTRASEELHITQSALSRSVAALEKEIGFALFERKRGGKIKLNTEGEYFLKYVTQMLNTLEQTVSAVHEMTGLTRGVVNIAIAESVFLKNVFYDFLLDYPEVRLNCRLQSYEQMISSLRDGTVNFGICRHPLDDADLIWEPLYEDHMTVMLSKGHHLSHHKELSLKQLKDEHFIISNLGYDMESEFVVMCRKAGFEPYVVYEGSGEDLSGLLVAQGIGIMLTPHSVNIGLSYLPAFQGDGINPIRISDDFTHTQIGIVSKGDKFQSKASIMLKERIVNYFESMSKI